jgi:hypothetical protein
VPKYKGPERRVRLPLTRRKVRKLDLPFGNYDITGDRRISRDYQAGRSGSFGMGYVTPESADGFAPNLGHDIVEFKDQKITERRMSGAGRRKGDLARALETGESAIFQVGKGSWKQSAKKLAKKAGKAGKLGLGAIALYDMVNRKNNGSK